MKPVRLPIVSIDRPNKTALVKSKKGTFPVKMEMESWKIEDVRLGDDAMVVKSSVSGEWLMIDYRFDNAFNYAVHNSMQDKYEDMICDEEGRPYAF